MSDSIPYSPQEVDASTGLIHVIKYRYLIDIHTYRTRISKMQMQIIIDRFLRSEKSKEYKLNIYEKIIIVVLAGWMADKLNCWPSLKTLAENCSMSKDSLIRNISLLENKKLLLVTRKHNKNNEYEFTNLVLDSITNIVDNSKHGSRSQRHHGRSQLPEDVAHSDTIYINNNINNNISKSYPQAENYTPAKTAEKGSPLFEEMKKVIK